MIPYKVIDEQNKDSIIDEDLVDQSMNLIKIYNKDHSKYNRYNYEYELEIILLDNSEQGKEFFPNLDHENSEFFNASFQPIIMPTNYYRGVIFIFVDMIYEESSQINHLPKTVFLCALSHEMQHYFQCNFLGVDDFIQLNQFHNCLF